MFGSIGKFLNNAAKTAGKGIHTATHAAASATGAVGKAVSKVPVVGKGLHGAFDIMGGAPFKLADGLASGQRIDKVALSTLKNQIADVKEVAPYAQVVISQVPGVGSGVSGAISASLALAEGQPITAVMEEGIKGAMPGGPLAKSLYAVATGALSGKSIKSIGIDALPIPEGSKKALAIGLTATQQLASGHPVDKTMLDAGHAALPPEAKKACEALKKSGKTPAEALASASLSMVATDPAQVKAIQIGMAVGHAKVLQQVKATALKTPSTLNALAAEGAKAVAGNPVLAAAGSHLDVTGFNVGAALMRKAGVTAKDIATVRGQLKGPQLAAFDTALATHIGLVTKPPLPADTAPATQAAYYATHGAVGTSQAHASAIMAPMARDPKKKAGATAALKETAKLQLSWWHRVKRALHLEKAA